MQKDNEKFSFTYSAPTEAERREIESIRRQYKSDVTEESSIDRLRRVHSRVAGTATAASLAVGILGLLIFGGGMALALELEMLALGIAVSVVGIVPIVLAYPIYNRILARNKEKYGEEILRLSDEILGEQ